jgi:hypothetical protein
MHVRISSARGQTDGETAVPFELVRRAQYPIYVSPLLHGEPHQSMDEVRQAIFSDKPAQRWPHIYTGNSQQALTMPWLQTLVDPMANERKQRSNPSPAHALI